MSMDLRALLRRQYVGPSIPTPQAMVTAQATAQRSFDKRCEILRHLDMDTPEGGSAWTWVQAGVYQCRLEPVIEAKDAITVGPSVAVGYHLFLPNYADIRPSDRVGVPGWFNAWQANEPHVVGDYVIPTALQAGTGHYFQAVLTNPNASSDSSSSDSSSSSSNSSSSAEALSGATEPAWNNQHNSLTQDGDITWREMGPCSYFEVTGDDFDKSHEFEVMVRLKEIV